MGTLYREAPKMVENMTTKRELVWNIAGTEYKVLNVPTYDMNSEEKEYFDMDVTMKLSMIRDLMYADEIPHTVDFEEVADFDF